jgi:RimJ/RimL family protein N-acetyltransferase
MKFTLRPLTDADLDSLVKYANNYKIAKNLTNLFPHPYAEENGRQFIGMNKTAGTPNVMAIDVGGELVGCIGVHPQKDIMCKNAELGYWLAEPFWGKGIMTEAVQQMVEYGFKHWDIDRIFARPFGSNTASQKVLEKAGFVLEAHFKKTIFKFGNYEDELVYATRRKG